MKWNKVLSKALCAALVMTAAGAMAVAPDATKIESIQANVVPNFYGYKVGTVDVTYKEGTDLSQVTVGDFTVYDRGFQNPEFGKVEVTSAKVNGNVVTLGVDQGTDKTADRSRETYGTLCTSSAWYVDSENVVHYGAEATVDALGNKIAPNTIKKGLQWRKNMDLVLCVNSEDIAGGIRSTDGSGNMLADTVWKDANLTGDLDKVTLEMVDVGWEAANYTMLGEEGKVPVQVIWPEGYDANRAEKYPVVVYQCGGGVCYWEVTDGSTTNANNLGCNVVYDVMMTEWHRQFPGAIVMSVNVHSSDVVNSAKEIAGVLDYAAANWNIDKDKVIVTGNSQGTLIASDFIRQRPDLVAAFVECNGNFGAIAPAARVDGTLANSSLAGWTEEEVKAVIDNNVSFWMFNGETDGDNPAAQQDVIEIVKNLYREAGKTEEWIDLHVRASGLQSWKFKKWGETDHSVTKVVAWDYLGRAYDDPAQGGIVLNAGDRYTYAGMEEPEKYKDMKIMDYRYTVYPESVAEWAQKVIAD
ncbi:MAG: hypothetical protein Q4C53_07845 [Clostridia bacterium]|nr:hypothetical protein [Clostridia bacterium]